MGGSPDPLYRIKQVPGGAAIGRSIGDNVWACGVHIGPDQHGLLLLTASGLTRHLHVDELVLKMGFDVWG